MEEGQNLSDDIAESSFLQLAEEDLKSHRESDFNNSNLSIVDTDQTNRLVNDIQNPLNLPFARLNFNLIKPADRATYLLNYLYMQIQSN